MTTRERIDEHHLVNKEFEAELCELGFIVTNETLYARELMHPGLDEFIYIMKPYERRLAVDPRHLPNLGHMHDIRGQRPKERFGSNFRKFPSKLRKGKKEERYGASVHVPNKSVAQDLLDVLKRPRKPAH